MASRICISNQFPAVTDAAGLGTISGKSLLQSVGDESQISIVWGMDYEGVEAGYVNYSFKTLS